MRFQSKGRPDSPLGLKDCLLQGYPAGGGLFLPHDEADLRPAVYGPDLGFFDAAAMAVSALLPAEADPQLAFELASAFDLPADASPAFRLFEDDILILDLGRSPGGSATWFSAAFTAALLPWASGTRKGGPSPVALAAAEGKEASALAEAFGRASLPLCLLLPEGGNLAGLRPSLLARAGGSVHALEVLGDPLAARRLERELAGGRLGSRPLVAVGSASPGRLLGRVILLVALFSLARRGVAGDLLVAAPPHDSLSLLTGLWAWRWGLPVTAFVAPRPVAEEKWSPDPAAGLVEDFFADVPLHSLVIEEATSLGEARAAALALREAGGPPLDRDSAHALAAARSARAAGLAGHARLVVPRFAAESWAPLLEGEGGSLTPPPPVDARIEAGAGSVLAYLSARGLSA